MSGFFKELDKLGKQLDQGLNKGIHSAENVYNENRTSPTLDCFRSGAVVQLVSNASRGALQIVQAPQGGLIMDGLGPESPQATHAHWFVTNHGKNIVSLQNQNNFITVINGVTHLSQHASLQTVTANSKFRLVEVAGNMQFESVPETKCYLAILPNGQLKPANLAVKGPETQFGVRIVISAPPPPQPTASGKPTAVATATTSKR